MNQLEKIIASFDPEGDDYDYETARKLGFSPDGTGHWPSRDPRTGMILKGRNHQTWDKTLAADAALGYDIRKEADGRYYSKKHGEFYRSSPDDNDSHWSDFEAHLPYDKDMHPLARYGEQLAGVGVHYPLRYGTHTGPHGTETRQQPRARSGNYTRLGQYGPRGLTMEQQESNKAELTPFALTQDQYLPNARAVVLGGGYRNVEYDDNGIMRSVPTRVYEHEQMHAAMDDPRIQNQIQAILATLGGEQPEHDIINEALGTHAEPISTLAPERLKSALTRVGRNPQASIALEQILQVIANQ